MNIIIESTVLEKWQHSLLSHLHEHSSDEIRIFSLGLKNKSSGGLINLITFFENRIRKINNLSYKATPLQNVEVLSISDLKSSLAGNSIINLTETDICASGVIPKDISVSEIYYATESSQFTRSPYVIFTNSDTLYIKAVTKLNGEIIHSATTRTSNNQYFTSKSLSDLKWNSLELLKLLLKTKDQGKQAESIKVNSWKPLMILFPAMQKTLNLFISKFFTSKNTKWTIALKNKNTNITSTLIPEKDYFLADPFIVEEDSQLHLFVEHFSYPLNKGLLSYINIENNSISEPVLILEEPFHLSYPHVFFHEGCYYMIPETRQSNSVRLYKCIEFPLKWSFLKTIIDHTQLSDVTLFKHDSIYWMFANTCVENTNNSIEKLHLFYTDDPINSEWQSHPLNPIVSDVCSSRPAGNLFVKEGKIYRPSQDSGKTYGYAVNINEIVCLSKNNYEERLIRKISPDDVSLNALATHTYNQTASYEVFDIITKLK